MNRAAYEKAARDRNTATYKAMGLLQSLLEFDEVPTHSIPNAQAIVAEYKAANKALEASCEESAA